ncbi:tRNA (cytosine-5-)-methyltransferase [Mactra antiquata]
MAALMKCMRVLELYSGMGGMHCALTKSGIPYEVVMAMDINTNANNIYSQNFPKTVVNSSAIEAMTVKHFDDLKIDMILMSPPCQPFTRVGKQKDTDDVRTKSFLHVLDVLQKTEKKPDYILLENVKGFECSDSRQRLIDTLQACHYNYQEFLLTPLQFGIPNLRLRYFIIAKQQPSAFNFDTSDQILTTVPECARGWSSWKQVAEKQEESGLNQVCACYGRTDSHLNQQMDASSKSSNQKRNFENLKLESGDSENVNKRLKLDDTKDFDASNDAQTATKKCASIETDGLNITCDNEPKSDGDNKEKSSKAQEKSLISVEAEDAHKEILSGADKDKGSPPDCLENYGENFRLPFTEEHKLYGSCLKLHNFLEDDFNNVDIYKDYLIAEKNFKRLVIMDIVNGCSTKTCCFTKRYGHYMDGAGSLVLMTTDIQAIRKASVLKDTVSELKNRDEWSDKEYSIIRDLKLRYFTPREIANLLCFPSTYKFPEGFSKRQLYMLLGNSLNVHIVSVLIKLMTACD